MDILLVGSSSSLAHIARPLALGRALTGSAHRVTFACGPRHRRLVEDAGLVWTSLDSLPGEELNRRLAAGRPLFRAEELRADVRADLELFDRVRPDLVVADFRVSMGISAAVARVPYAALCNAHWSPYSTQPLPVPEHPLVSLFGLTLSKAVFPLVLPHVLKGHVADFNRVRRERGLPPVRSLQEMYTTADWTLYCDVPSLERTGAKPASHRYIGPLLWEPAMELPGWWQRLDGRELVYVSMGSTGDQRLLSPVVELLSRRSSRAVVVASCGQALAVPPRDNVFVADYLPGMQVMRRAALMVCNGGSGSVYQALAHGVPVLGLPVNMDQHLVMDAVSSAGAGLSVRAGMADAESVGGAAERLLRDERFAERAREIQAEIRRYRGGERFLAFLDNSVAPAASLGR